MSEALMIRSDAATSQEPPPGLFLALAVLLYIGAVIAFIIIY